MTLISLLFALLIEQVRPIRHNNAIHRKVDEWLLKAKPVGQDMRRAWAVWVLLVAGISLSSLLLLGLLQWGGGMLQSALLELLLTVGVLYLTMGFRRFSHWFHEIQSALRMNDLPAARAVLGRWVETTGGDSLAKAASRDGSAAEVSREAIRLALVAAQRQVFGVIFWFVLLPGPAGALAYWLSTRLLNGWAGQGVDHPTDAAGRVAMTAYRWLDWAPVRFTAAIFAVMGNFEDSVAMWRSRAASAPGSRDDTDRILLASGAGAMGIRLSVPDASVGYTGLEEANLEGADRLGGYEPDLREADLPSLDTATGLVWRSIVMWFFMVLLFHLGRWFS
jgi:membrane protein required for beta-lactamase induction